jgi:predicted membrane-bound dolichyl-phosphate-mannose-protein mannosyltransferase
VPGGRFGGFAEEARSDEVPALSSRALGELSTSFLVTLYFHSCSCTCTPLDPWTINKKMFVFLLRRFCDTFSNPIFLFSCCTVLFLVELKAYKLYLAITYYWTGLLILDHSYLVGNLTNSKIAETKASISNFQTC